MDSSAGWIIEPASRCVEFIADETRIAALLQRALAHAEHAAPLLQSVQKIARTHGDRAFAAAARTLADAAPFHEEWARQLRESDYSVMNAHSLIAIWGALETCIEDTIANIILYSPSAASRLEALNVTMERSDASEDSVYAIVSKLERKLVVRGDIVATYDAFLGHFGLEAPTSSEAADALREANAVRNCLLHRGGRIDSRATRTAPSLAGREGQVISVSSQDYLRYYSAVGEWATALLTSAGSSPYFRAVQQP